MEVTLLRFIAALRSADIRVSPAETLDGLAIANRVGVANPVLLRDSLSLALAKTRADKLRFDDCFERFFHQLAFGRAAKQSLLRRADRAAIDALIDSSLDTVARNVVRDVLDGNRTALAARVEANATSAGIATMTTLRDKATVAARLGDALGLSQIDGAVRAPPRSLSGDDQAALRYARSYLVDEIRSYVDLQYTLRVDASGRRALIAAALEGNLNQIPPHYHQAVKESIQRLAARLRRGRRKQRRSRRGALDIKRTLRRNVSYGEALFDLRWRHKRREEATVFVLCDVSGSVAPIARFLLLLIYELADVLPNVRTFAFSNRLGEITSLCRDKPMDVAIETTLFDWGKGTTDYGRAWRDFSSLTAGTVDHRSTVIVLGDARNNFFDPGVDDFRATAHRAGRLFWLNPEDAAQWREGDCEMPRFAPYCTRVFRLSSLRDLRRIADSLVATFS